MSSFQNMCICIGLSVFFIILFMIIPFNPSLLWYMFIIPFAFMILLNENPYASKKSNSKKSNSKKK